MLFLGYKVDSPKLKKISVAYLKVFSGIAVFIHAIKFKLGLLPLTSGEKKQIKFNQTLRNKIN